MYKIECLGLCLEKQAGARSFHPTGYCNEFKFHVKHERKILKFLKQERGVIKFTVLQDNSGCHAENRWKDSKSERRLLR